MPVAKDIPNQLIFAWKGGAQLPIQRNRSAVLILIAIFALAVTSLAQEGFFAKVVGIDDGDTIDVLAAGNVQYRIRLAGIDAPEHGQAYGTKSSQNLGGLIYGKQVNLDCGNEESYGRKVCKVLLPGGEDAGLDQVKAGLAWHYKQYAFAQTPSDRQVYAAAEDSAREAHLGLWTDAHPVQPQDFRHGSQSSLCLDKQDHRIACSEQYEGPVRANRRSGIYHWPGCPDYDKIAEHNAIEYPSSAAAQAAGFRAARNCP